MKLSLGNAGIIGKTCGGYDFAKGDLGSVKDNHNSREEARIQKDRVWVPGQGTSKSYGSHCFGVTNANIFKE